MKSPYVWCNVLRSLSSRFLHLATAPGIVGGNHPVYLVSSTPRILVKKLKGTTKYEVGDIDDVIIFSTGTPFMTLNFLGAEFNFHNLRSSYSSKLHLDLL